MMRILLIAGIALLMGAGRVSAQQRDQDRLEFSHCNPAEDAARVQRWTRLYSRPCCGDPVSAGWVEEYPDTSYADLVNNRIRVIRLRRRGVECPPNGWEWQSFSPCRE